MLCAFKKPIKLEILTLKYKLGSDTSDLHSLNQGTGMSQMDFPSQSQVQHHKLFRFDGLQNKDILRLSFDSRKRRRV